jgi:hypothetical protein
MPLYKNNKRVVAVKSTQGTHGHTCAADLHPAFTDRRLKQKNSRARTNKCPRDGKSEFIHTGTEQAGRHYADARTCTECAAVKSKSEFKNMAVNHRNRGECGLNVRCRDCQMRFYSNGYKIDGFIDDRSDCEYSDEDAEEWTEDSDDDSDDSDDDEY